MQNVTPILIDAKQSKQEREEPSYSFLGGVSGFVFYWLAFALPFLVYGSNTLFFLLYTWPFFLALMPLSVLIGITLSMLLRGRLILTLLLTGTIVLCLFWLVFSFLPEAPVIMIGPGTGIAPFRAFMQQRDADGAGGKNWLFFGNPHFTEDFLYQVEWQRYVKDGLLTRIDLAWSRDQQHKIYVQDKLREQGAEVWRWIQEGAHIYVCGDANRMAKDVENTLLELVAEHGGMDTEQADEFLSELRLERRYQRDVY